MMNLSSRVITHSIDSKDPNIEITGNYYDLPEHNGIMIIDREDAYGNPTPSSQEVIVYSSLDFTGGNVVLRGVQRGAMGSPATSHAAAALIEPLNQGPVRSSSPLKDELKKLL